jgi:hypothetical protein
MIEQPAAVYAVAVVRCRGMGGYEVALLRRDSNEMQRIPSHNRRKSLHGEPTATTRAEGDAVV